ncbi:MAG: FliG C-terminal domain-containing protein [Parvularculaceae bacterium]|nr:FliG C-terminal domain-containing protein [Parvularculaceae bacterium]
MRNSLATLPPPKASPLTPAQKAAIVLASLPRDVAAAIVADIDDTHLAAVIRAVSEMRAASPQARIAAAQDFIAEVLRRREELPAGPSEASRLLGEVADKARVERVMAAIAPTGASSGDLWRKAAALPAARIVDFLRGQRIQTAAAILSNLPPATAAEILAAAPLDFSKLLAGAIARLEKPDEVTAEAIARAIETELFSGAAPANAAPVASVLFVDMLDLLPASLREGLISHIGAGDEGMAATIRSTLLTFQILPERLTEVAVAALVRTAERSVLMQALKLGETNAPTTNDYLLANMSKRMADQLREELAGLAPPSEAEGEAAQRAIVAAVKTLEKSGDIKLVRPK